MAFRAAPAEGNPKSVKELFDNGADVNAQDDEHGNTGEMTLWLAARYGHEAVVRLLLAEDGGGADSKDQDGRTPLSLAAGYGYETVVKLLLAKEGVDPDSTDQYGRTPLSLAARYGHQAVVKLLLAIDGVDPDSKNEYDRTPLSWAAGYGHETVVKLLLAKDGIDPDSKDQYGRTPLLLAAANGHETVVRLLLAKDGVDPDSKITLDLQGDNIETEMNAMGEDHITHTSTTILSRSETRPLSYIELVYEKGLFTNVGKLFRKWTRPRLREGYRRLEWTCVSFIVA
jgi:ankyrin repeat protein